MKILIVDTDCCGLDFALRCLAGGHQVKWFLGNKSNGERNKAGDGLVEKVGDWQAWMRWADLVFPTANNKYLLWLEKYRKYGYPIFGPSLQSARLEIDRKLGMQVLEDHGIECPPYKTFSRLSQAEQYARDYPDRLVFKTLGDEEDKSLSYVSKSRADMVAKIAKWQKTGMKLKGECMLQEFMPGIEFAVSGWLGSDGWIGPWNENFEHKKLMSGNHGPNTGEMGTVMKYVKDSTLAEKMLVPLTDYLLEIGHRGDVDVNCIIAEDGTPYPLEFTCRPGWPAFAIQCSCHNGDPAQWMCDALEGEDSLDVDDSVATGLVIAQPDFPYSRATQKETAGVPVEGLDLDDMGHLHPFEVMIGKVYEEQGDEITETTGPVTSGDYILVAVGLGETVRESAKRAYKLSDSINVPNKIIRDDIGEGLKSSLPKLHEYGFAAEFDY